MDIPYILVSVLALVFLFLFAVKKFSHQVERVAGDKFKITARNVTSTPLRGTFIGAIITALLHSSAATTVMTVSLVNAGVISFYNSLGIIFGANIGTTFTLQLFAFNVGNIAPYIVILGFILQMTHTRLQKYGKMIFYFGLMFFCLSFISALVSPLQSDPRIADFFALVTNGFGASLLVGLVFSVLFQSSTVASGISMILAASGLIGLPEAVEIMLGANIGTTSTALLSSISLDRTAKKTAVAHFLFNVLGVLLLIPFFKPFVMLLQYFGGSIEQQIANAHVIFNVVSTIIALIFVSQFAKLVELCMPKKPESEKSS